MSVSGLINGTYTYDVAAHTTQTAFLQLNSQSLSTNPSHPGFGLLANGGATDTYSAVPPPAAGSAGQSLVIGSTTGGPGGLLGLSWASGSKIQAVTLVPAGAYAMVVSDQIIDKTGITHPGGDIVTLLAPAGVPPLARGTTVTVKDTSGNAGVDNITVVSAGGAHIDGQATYVINAGYGVLSLFTDGVNWFSFDVDGVAGGGVTSVSAGSNISCSPNPITAIGTVAVTATPTFDTLVLTSPSATEPKLTISDTNSNAGLFIKNNGAAQTQIIGRDAVPTSQAPNLLLKGGQGVAGHTDGARITVEGGYDGGGAGSAGAVQVSSQAFTANGGGAISLQSNDFGANAKAVKLVAQQGHGIQMNTDFAGPSKRFSWIGQQWNRVTVSDVNYNISPDTDPPVQIVAYTSLTAPRQVMLFPAIQVVAGHTILIKDEIGLAAAHPITVIGAAGLEHIDGAASVILDKNYGTLYVYSDGNNSWHVCDVESGGTVTSLTPGPNMQFSSNPITTSGSIDLNPNPTIQTLAITSPSGTEPKLVINNLENDNGAGFKVALSAAPGAQTTLSGIDASPGWPASDITIIGGTGHPANQNGANLTIRAGPDNPAPGGTGDPGELALVSQAFQAGHGGSVFMQSSDSSTRVKAAVLGVQQGQGIQMNTDLANKLNSWVGQQWNRVTTGVNYNASNLDQIIACTANNITVTLVDATTVVPGHVVWVVDEAGLAGTLPITVACQGGQTISGLATRAIIRNFSSLAVYSTTTGWTMMGPTENLITNPAAADLTSNARGIQITANVPLTSTGTAGAITIQSTAANSGAAGGNLTIAARTQGTAIAGNVSLGSVTIAGSGNPGTVTVQSLVQSGATAAGSSTVTVQSQYLGGSGTAGAVTLQSTTTGSGTAGQVTVQSNTTLGGHAGPVQIQSSTGATGGDAKAVTVRSIAQGANVSAGAVLLQSSATGAGSTPGSAAMQSVGPGSTVSKLTCNATGSLTQTILNLDSQIGQVESVRAFTVGVGGQAILSSDWIAAVPTTIVGGATGLVLPSPGAVNIGRVFVVKDTGGFAGLNDDTNAITVTCAGTLIDGATSSMINVNYGSRKYYTDGANWFTESGSGAAAGYKIPVKTVTANAYTILPTDRWLVTTNAGATTLTLPAATFTGPNGLEFLIKAFTVGQSVTLASGSANILPANGTSGTALVNSSVISAGAGEVRRVFFDSNLVGLGGQTGLWVVS